MAAEQQLLLYPCLSGECREKEERLGEGRARVRKSKYKFFDELPLMKTVPCVANVLDIGIAHAYEMVRQKEFPTIALGSHNRH